MAAIEKLKEMGIYSEDPVEVSSKIGESTLKKAEKAILLRDYLRESRKSITVAIYEAARDYLI